jgi:CBS domain-containing protein
MTVAAILKQKGRNIADVAPTALVSDVAALLSERRIGAVLVRDAAEQLLGIVSERDIVNSMARHGASVLTMTAGQLMTRNLQTATTRTTVAEAMALMTTGRFRHLPVMDGNTVVGIVSIGDVVKSRMDQQAHEVDSLKAYVSGK